LRINLDRLKSKNYAPKIAAHSNQNREYISQLKARIDTLEHQMDRVYTHLKATSVIPRNL